MNILGFHFRAASTPRTDHKLENIQHFLPASERRFFNASDHGTPLILSLTTPRAVDATAFLSLCNNGNEPLAKRLNSHPTPYHLCIIVHEYTGIPLPRCKHATY